MIAGYPFTPLQQLRKLTRLPPTVTIVVDDANFDKLVKGQAKAQNLFMQGKLKIRGDIMKATRLDPILAKAQTKAKM